MKKNWGLRSSFIWETGESGDINVCRNKTLNCYPNNTNELCMYRQSPVKTPMVNTYP